jgi:hypothetical protein
LSCYISSPLPAEQSKSPKDDTILIATAGTSLVQADNG